MTDLSDIVDLAELYAAQADGLITVRETDGLEIRNYSARATYTPGAWSNAAVRACRGIISDPETGQVLARPWAKFFNYGQEETGPLELDGPVEVTDKLDGSLGIVYRDRNGDLRVATRGSMASEQAIHATAWLRRQGWAGDLGDLSRVTPLAEIIYPENRIVCDYGTRDELVLLGGVVIATGDYLGPRETAHAVGWAGAVVTVLSYDTLQEALAAPPRPGAEGLCVRMTAANRIVKIKQDDYVQLHRIVTELSEKTVWRHMSEYGLDEASLGELLAPLPDEFHDWTRAVWAEIAAEHDAIMHAVSSVHAEIVAALPDGFSRKDYAMRAVPHVDLRTFLFMVLDSRDPSPTILRGLEPSGNRQPKDFDID